MVERGKEGNFYDRKSHVPQDSMKSSELQWGVIGGHVVKAI